MYIGSLRTTPYGPGKLSGQALLSFLCVCICAKLQWAGQMIQVLNQMAGHHWNCRIANAVIPGEVSIESGPV